MQCEKDFTLTKLKLLRYWMEKNDGCFHIFVRYNKMTPIFIKKTTSSAYFTPILGRPAYSFSLSYIFSDVIYTVEVSTWNYTPRRVMHAFRCLRHPVYIKAINARLTTACFQRSRDCAISDGVSAIQWALFLNRAHGPRSSRGFLSAYLCLSATANKRGNSRMFVDR